jgi:hypothetical protein
MEECTMAINKTEKSLRTAFQKAARADNTPVVKNLLKKADEHNMTLLEYITETDPEIREIFDRMLAAAAAQRQTEKNEPIQ